MELVKEEWTKSDRKEFVLYLETFKKTDKIEWTKKIINTNMNVLAIPSPILAKISKELKKGNYLSFLDLELNDYYENTCINGNLIASIKDFNLMKKYLDKYSLKIDNWASCDLLKFDIKNNEENYYNLSLEYIESKLPFIRRLGLSILFKFINNDYYVNKIFEILDKFENEKEYYVNMMAAWLFCEMFIKRKNETINYLKTNKLNKFTINKGISKCRDSYRITKEDKDYLKAFKK